MAFPNASEFIMHGMWKQFFKDSDQETEKVHVRSAEIQHPSAWTHLRWKCYMPINPPYVHSFLPRLKSTDATHNMYHATLPPLRINPPYGFNSSPTSNSSTATPTKSNFTSSNPQPTPITHQHLKPHKTANHQSGMFATLTITTNCILTAVEINKLMMMMRKLRL